MHSSNVIYYDPNISEEHVECCHLGAAPHQNIKRTVQYCGNCANHQIHEENKQTW